MQPPRERDRVLIISAAAAFTAVACAVACYRVNRAQRRDRAMRKYFEERRSICADARHHTTPED